MASKGYIKLHRQIQDCEIWCGSEPFDMRSAWIDLLMLANHEDKNTLFDYKPITIKRGQYLTSIRQLGARWSWSKNRTLKYLRLLEKLKMIEKESTNQRTLLTIVNYSVYQDTRDTDVDTGIDTVIDTGMPQTINEKNERNNINSLFIKYSPHFSEFWNHYPKKTEKGNAYKCYKARLNDGFSEDELLTACINYAEECKRENRELKYIKNGSTFLSATTPFVDYLKKGDINDSGVGRTVQSDEEREAEIRRYLESDEFRNADDEDLF